MTYQETVENYKKLFIMLVEQAGRETGNTSYLNVESILEKDKKYIDQLIEEEADFNILVSGLITLVLIDIYGVEQLVTWEREDSGNKISEFYAEFLKSPSKKFCEKYGLESFDDPCISFKMYKIGEL